MAKSGGSGEAPTPDEVRQFLDMRQHIRRTQEGTPLLLRTAAFGRQEELKICTFWVADDLETLRWRDQEGEGKEESLRFALVSNVKLQEVEGTDDEDNSHFAITLTLRGKNNTMELICPGMDDFRSWSEAMKFLVEAQQPEPAVTIAARGNTAASTKSKAMGKPSPQKAPSPATSTSAAPAPAPKASTSTPALLAVGADALAPTPKYWTSRAAQNVSMSVPASPACGGSFRDILPKRRLSEAEEDSYEFLKRENARLQEIIRLKDKTIEDLMKDAQRRAAETLVKTENTSRESDDHLRAREQAIAKRTIQKLRKTVKSQKRTISDLLKMLARANEGGESSATENDALAKDIDEDDEDSEADRVNEDDLDASSCSKPNSEGKFAPRSSPVNQRGTATPLVPSSGGGPVVNSALAEDEEAELQELAEKLARLESVVSGLGFNPPPRPAAIRGGGGGAAALAGTRTAPASNGNPSAAAASELEKLLGLLGQAGMANMPRSAASAPAAAAPKEAAQDAKLAEATRAARSATASLKAGLGDVSGLGPRSVAALEALAREMQTLEEKKRVVEMLARDLEPPSEDEDDDFPLR